MLTEGATSIGTVTADATGHWSYTPTGLVQGAHTIVASDTDLAGNTGTASLSFTLNSVAPAVTRDPGQRHRSLRDRQNYRQPALTGGGDANAVVTLTEGATIARHGDRRRHRRLELHPDRSRPGAHTIVASETNVAGNTGTASLSFTLDTAAPSIAITSAGGPTNQVNQTITGTVDIADAGATVTLLDGTTAVGTAIVQSNGSWSSPVTLGQGGNSMTAAGYRPCRQHHDRGAVFYT